LDNLKSLHVLLRGLEAADWKPVISFIHTGGILIVQYLGWRAAGKSDISRNGDLTLDIHSNYLTTVFFSCPFPKPCTVVPAHPYNGQNSVVKYETFC